MRTKHRLAWVVFVGVLLSPIALLAQDIESKAFVPLFPDNGAPTGFVVRNWNDVSQPLDAEVVWTIKDGILHGSKQRGSWLVSEKEYGDFVLEFEFKLGPLGNSGCALRAPAAGDPAFEGMELQMVDYRYNTDAKDSELTGGIYRAIAPRKQIYKPTEWNKYRVTLKGSHLHVELNGQVIHDLDLDQQSQVVKRHDNSQAPLVKDRPRCGRIGFQDLSRGDDRVQIRGARVQVLD